MSPSNLSPGDRIHWRCPDPDPAGADSPCSGTVTARLGKFAVAIQWDDGSAVSIPIDCTSWWGNVTPVVCNSKPAVGN